MQGPVGLSSDGNTAIVGGGGDNGGIGAAWIYTRSGGIWTQQGPKLIGTGAVGNAAQGSAVALSADGDTAVLGGPGDSSGVGAAWVFTRSGGVWTQQGPKLVGTGSGAAAQGSSVAISGDGNTLLLGGPLDNGNGAVWVFTRSGGVWTQQGAKLVSLSPINPARQGTAVALSFNGDTAIIGGPNDSANAGGAWVFTRSGGVWTQQSGTLFPGGFSGSGVVVAGVAVALSGDGNTAAMGGPGDGSNDGAVWVFTRSAGVWSQQGGKLRGSDASAFASQGRAVALSADGDTLVIGGPFDTAGAGATFLFTRSAGVWTQQGSKLVGSGATGPLDAQQGSSVAASADGTTVIAGGPRDNNFVGAAWVFSILTPVPAISQWLLALLAAMLAAIACGGPGTRPTVERPLTKP